jgi:two-component system chemotaxis response regulator CheB
MARIDLIVIGASAGGVEALCNLVRQIPADLGAAVLVVMHLGEASALPDVLNRCGTLPCAFVNDSPAMERGHLYIAPPNYHMRVDDEKIVLSQGPKENLRRPSIDPLFRSAARLYRNKVIGIILTGALDDGSAGLFAIKSRGGITIVQDPTEAFEPSMPIHAMRHTKVDYRVPIKKMGPLLVKLVGRGKRNDFRLKPSKVISASTSTRPQGGTPLPVSCPECQGPLFTVKEEKEKYFHCRVGHAFSSESLNEAHDEALERALWTSIRMLSEKIILHKTMEQRSKRKDPRLAKRLRETVEYAQKEIDLLKEILKNF